MKRSKIYYQVFRATCVVFTVTNRFINGFCR